MTAIFELLGTSACTLCTEAEALVRPIVEAFGWSLVILDVAEDEDLYERFGMRIPVLRRSDVAEALCWPFCARDVEALAMVPHG
ncbi:MAG: glutaredoxin family protein [Pseudomonadota bacterium]|nr:glutaredoxin family protein [Pseudomonadota bacterium]